MMLFCFYYQEYANFGTQVLPLTQAKCLSQSALADGCDVAKSRYLSIEHERTLL